MLRYFISYKNLINDNKILKELDIYSPEIKIMKKNKNGTYRVEPILYFTGYANDLLSYAEKIEYNKKGIMLMVELTSVEAKEFEPLIIKKFETVDNNINLLKLKDKHINLINYSTLINMDINELENGHIIILKNISNNKELFHIDKTKDKKIFVNSINNLREKLMFSKLGSDIYYYTSDNDILEKYKNDTTKLIEVEPYVYKLADYKLFVIDSIPQDRIYNLSSSTIRYLYMLCNNALQINISENDDGTYDIMNYKIDKRKKKAYIILEPTFVNCLYDSSITPLLKYINVYVLNGECFEKINIEEYMKDRNILKYIKKPNRIERN